METDGAGYLIKVYLEVKCMGSLLNSYLVCISKRVVAQVNKNDKNRVIVFHSVPRLEPVYRTRTPCMKGNLAPLEEGHCQKCILLIFLPDFPKGIYGLLPG